MKRQRKSIKLQVRVCPQENQALVAIAAKDNKCVSEILRLAIREAAQKRGITIEATGGVLP